MPLVAISLMGPNQTPARHDSDSRRAPRQTEPPHQQGREKPEPDDQLRLEHAGVLGALDEILLQQIVGDRRLDFDAGKERIERRRDDLARAEGRRPDEDDLVLEHVRRQLPAHHVDRRDVGERAFRTAIAEQEIALAVERDGPAVEQQRRRVHVGDAQRHVARAEDRRERGQREARIDLSVALDEDRRAPQQRRQGPAPRSGTPRRWPPAVSTDRLQIEPVAWKNGSSAESSRRMMARPSGMQHARAPARCGASNVIA